LRESAFDVTLLVWWMFCCLHLFICWDCGFIVTLLVAGGGGLGLVDWKGGEESVETCDDSVLIDDLFVANADLSVVAGLA